MPGGPLRVGALIVSGLFVMFYIVIVAQIVWVCQMNVESNHTGYVAFYKLHFSDPAHFTIMVLI
jgi:hypothetical protein